MIKEDRQMELITEISQNVSEEPVLPDIAEPVYQVYVRADEQGRVTAVGSSAFLTDTEGWTLIDEGTEWPRYMHAQGNYFPRPIYTEDGIHRYKLAPGAAVERTEEEIGTDRGAISAPAPSNEERIKALETGKADQTSVDELNEALELILSGDTGEGGVTDEA